MSAPRSDRDWSEQPVDLLAALQRSIDQAREDRRAAQQPATGPRDTSGQSGTPRGLECAQGDEERERRYGQACGDPGSITPRREGESLSRWSARAAITVADAEQEALRAEVERLRGELSTTDAALRAEQEVRLDVEAERDRLKAQLVRMRAKTWRLIEAVEDQCYEPGEPLCHDLDRTDDGECALVADLLAVLDDAAPEVGDEGSDR